MEMIDMVKSILLPFFIVSLSDESSYTSLFTIFVIWSNCFWWLLAATKW